MCMFVFFNVWVCVCVGFVMCGFVYVWVFLMCALFVVFLICG